MAIRHHNKYEEASLADFQNNARYRFFQPTYYHTCWLEHDIFILGWVMTTQKILSNGRPYKNHESPPPKAAIFLFMT